MIAAARRRRWRHTMRHPVTTLEWQAALLTSRLLRRPRHRCREEGEGWREAVLPSSSQPCVGSASGVVRKVWKIQNATTAAQVRDDVTCCCYYCCLSRVLLLRHRKGWTQVEHTEDVRSVDEIEAVEGSSEVSGSNQTLRPLQPHRVSTKYMYCSGAWVSFTDSIENNFSI